MAALRDGRHARHADALTQISVSGYKSLVSDTKVEVRPLTILAGANSSGKSSLMQPLLLLKQTLEASYDPGALLLSGPNVKFTSADQFFSRAGKSQKHEFSVGVESSGPSKLTLFFKKHPNRGVEIVRQESYTRGGERIVLTPDMDSDQIEATIEPYFSHKGLFGKTGFPFSDQKGRWVVERDKCFLEVGFLVGGGKGEKESMLFGFPPAGAMEPWPRGLIHVPGLRGNPARTYPFTAVGSTFPGTFESYVASIIVEWQNNNRSELAGVCADLEKLGLTWKVVATSINDTQVELQVGRLCHATRGGAWDLVNLADVGFGLSQTLPVVVALRAAAKNQVVYVEQPEIHLHPQAQFEMAELLAGAASRGATVIAETHSHVLLLGVQALVGEGRLAPEKVKLHWFRRGPDGTTQIDSADLDKEGRFGEWPEDFGQVMLAAESRYLDASTKRHVQR